MVDVWRILTVHCGDAVGENRAPSLDIRRTVGAPGYADGLCDLLLGSVGERAES